MRPRSSDIINRIFSNFRHYPETGGSLVTGESDYNDVRLVVIGQEKPKPENFRSKEDLKKLNWGMLTAQEHSKIFSVLKRAASREPERTVILTLIDTYGADISMESAERFQAFFIARLILEFLNIPVPTISVVLGEGGSGGALALQYTDRRAQLDDAIYATAPPESLAAIIFRDPERIEDALQLLKPTGRDLKPRGVIDTILPAPAKVADAAGYAAAIEGYLSRSVRELSKAKIKKLQAQRLKRAETFGRPTHSKLEGLLHSLEVPIVNKFMKAPPDVKVVDHTSLTEISDDYAMGQIVDPDQDYIRCGESSTKGPGRGCGRLVPLEEWVSRHHVCPFCGQAEVLGASGWIDCLTDYGSFHELNSNLTVDDILDARDIAPAYSDFLKRQEKRTQFKESLVTAQATIYGNPAVLAISEFNFAGGSMGRGFRRKTEAGRGLLPGAVPAPGLGLLLGRGQALRGHLGPDADGQDHFRGQAAQTGRAALYLHPGRPFHRRRGGLLRGPGRRDHRRAHSHGHLCRTPGHALPGVRGGREEDQGRIPAPDLGRDLRLPGLFPLHQGDSRGGLPGRDETGRGQVS